MRKLALLLLATLLAAGCSQSSTASDAATAIPTDVGTVVEEPTEAPGPQVAAPKLPKSYATLKSRDWQKLMKAPDKYIGKGYQVWACFSQFDAATGDDLFRGQASYKKLKTLDWYIDAANAVFTGDAKRLADFVQDDVVVMNAVGLGSLDYDTQAGGNTTVPLFWVAKITRKGSCK